MKDIESRKDIEKLVDRFYEQVRKDPLIGPFFTEIVQLNWDTHIPVICDFWESNLLDSTVYKGNPMDKHFALHAKQPLKEAHFDRWLSIWEKTVFELFSGTVAAEAIRKAQLIAGLMKYKIGQQGFL